MGCRPSGNNQKTSAPQLILKPAHAVGMMALEELTKAQELEEEVDEDRRDNDTYQRAHQNKPRPVREQQCSGHD